MGRCRKSDWQLWYDYAPQIWAYMAGVPVKAILRDYPGTVSSDKLHRVIRKLGVPQRGKAHQSRAAHRWWRPWVNPAKLKLSPCSTRYTGNSLDKSKNENAVPVMF